jgi:hypothetical protein
MASKSEQSGGPREAVRSLLRLIPGIGEFTAASVQPWLAGVFAVSMLAAAAQMLWPGTLGKPIGKFWRPIVVHPQVYLPRINRNLYAVDEQAGGNTVWVGGEAGFLAKSADGGVNWTCFTFETSDGTLDKPHSCDSEAAAGASASASVGFSDGLRERLGRRWSGLPKVYASQLTRPQPNQLNAPPNPVSSQPAEALSNAPSKTVSGMSEQSQSNAAQQISSNSIMLSETTHDFGPVVVNKTAEYGLILAAPSTSTRAIINNFKFASGNGPFYVNGAQSCELAKGNSCTAHITFSPLKVGPSADQLYFTATFLAATPSPSASTTSAPTTIFSIHVSGTGTADPTTPATSGTSASPPTVTSSTPVTYTAGDVVHLQTDDNFGVLVIVENGNIRLLTFDGHSAWVAPTGNSFMQARFPLPSDQFDPEAYLKEATKCPDVQGSGSFVQLVTDSLSLLKQEAPNCYLITNGSGVHVSSISYDPESHRGWAVGGVDGAGAVVRIDPTPWPGMATGYKLTPITRAAIVPLLVPIGLELPAPWFSVALLVCLFLLVAAIFGPKQPEKEGITGTAVSDRPLEPDDVDSVRLSTVADGISRFFRNPNTRAPLVICINGSWGWGKSSLMNLLADDLLHHVGDKHRVLQFNAWHHQSEDQILASLLQLVRIKALEPPWTPTGFGRRVLIFIKRWPERWFVSVIFCVSTAWTFYLAFEFLRHEEIFDVGKLAAFLPALVTTLVTLRQLIAGATGFLANPASLLATASSSSSGQLEAQTTLRERFAKDFRTVTEVLGNGKLVILIDDLDRCQPEKIREIVEAINFLVTAGECYIVLGMAREVVEYYLGNSFSAAIGTMPTALLGLTEAEAKKPGAREAAFANLYMQKLIQLQYNLLRLSDDQAISMFENSSTPLPDALPSAIPSPDSDKPKRNFEAETRAVLRCEHRLRGFLRGVQYWFMPLMGTALIVFAAISELRPSATFVQLKLAPLIHGTGSKPAGACVICNQQQENAPGSASAALTSSSAAPTSNSASASQSVAPAARSNKTGTGGTTQKADNSPPSLPVHITGVKPKDSQLDTVRFGPGIFQILLLVTVLSTVLWLVGQWWLVAIPDEEAAKDSQFFVTALRDWTPVLLTIYKTPRGLKQYLNHVRFLAMLQRALEPPSNEDNGQPLLRKIALFLIARREFFKHAGILNNLKQRASMGFSAERPIPDEILVALAAVESMPGLYESVQEMAGEHDSQRRAELSDDLQLKLRKAVENAAKSGPDTDLKSFAAKLKAHRQAFYQLNGGTLEPLQPTP